MSSQLTVRLFDDEDEEPVLRLLGETLGESHTNQRTHEWFAWKHLDNPFGRSIMLVAEDAEGIAGFRAFMRWDLATPADETLRCVRAVDTATHSRVRRQGVFRRLTEEAAAVARSEGVDLIFNTPNPRSRAGYLTMGWREVGRIGVMVRPTGRLARKTAELPSVGGSQPWKTRVVHCRPPRGLRTPRTPDYLDWRFGAHPFARYRVVDSGTASLAILRSNVRNGRPEVVVSELIGPDADVALRDAARNTDAAYLVGWFPPGTPERRLGIRSGLVPVPIVKALTLVARPLRRLDLDVVDLANWDLAMGDLELL